MIIGALMATYVMANYFLAEFSNIALATHNMCTLRNTDLLKGHICETDNRAKELSTY